MSHSSHSHRGYPGSFPVPSPPRMYATEGDRRMRCLPPLRMRSPPLVPAPKRHKSDSVPASDASAYYSHSVTGSERARSRQSSTAMDLYTLINRDPPADSDPRRNARFTSIGSVATQASQVSNTSQISRSSPIIFSDHKIPEKYPPYKENGRLYHSYRKGTYPLPCDEKELDRLDLFHHLFKVARVGDELFYAPLPSDVKTRVLDLGCGTGIWVLDVAGKFPKAYVRGCDIAKMQPPKPEQPPLLKEPWYAENHDFFVPFDFESPWTLGEESWDLIHMQMGSGSVASWISLYHRVYKHLKPGAWFEQVEIDFRPRCENENQKPGKALSTWYSNLQKATEATMRPMAHSSKETIKNLQDAGFTEIDHQTVGLPLNEWHSDAKEKKVGRWYNLALSKSFRTLSLAPFTRVLGWTVEEIDALVEELEHEIADETTHTFNLLHIYQARKPPVPN